MPQPQQFSQWLRARGIKVSLNDHPGYTNTEESILSTATVTPPGAEGSRPRRCRRSPRSTSIIEAWKFTADPNDGGLATW